MKNKKAQNNISEETSITTGGSTSSTTPGTSGSDKKTTVYTKPQDLKKTVTDLKGTDATVLVTNEAKGAKPIGKFSYLSEVKDDKTGEISKPFTINGKQYQVVRAMSPERKPVMGVYSLDERDEEGKNIIYDLKEFENNIAKKHLNEEPAKEAQIPQDTSDGSDKNLNFFKGHKHFIVNDKTGRVKKFKNIEEIANYKMEEGDKYMPIQKFRKYLDETLFGSRAIKEEPQTGAVKPEEPQAVTHLFNLIDNALPKDVYQNIKQNPVAQSAAITGWIDRIGVPQTQVNNLVNYLRGAVKQAPQQTTTTTVSAPASAPVTESKNVIKTLKVNDLK